MVSAANETLKPWYSGVVDLLEELDMVDLLEELDIVNLLEELDMVDLLEVSDMEVSLEKGLLEQLLRLWLVSMDSPTVESTGAKTANIFIVSNFIGHNKSQTKTHKTYKRQNLYNASVWKLIFIIFIENKH